MDNLLEPSLRGDLRRAPHSVGSALWVAFLGGPFAIVGYAALNSSRMGRLRRDAPWYAVALVAFLVVFATCVVSPETLGLEPYLSGGDPSPYPRPMVLESGLLLWLGVYAMHRPEYRAMRLSGVEPPSTCLPALVCIVAGNVPVFLLGQWLTTTSRAGAGL